MAQLQEDLDRVLSLLPRVQETDRFVQLAAVVGIAVPDEIQENRRRMYRLVNNYLNSDDFDGLPDQGAEVTQQMLNLLNGWFPAPEPVVPAPQIEVAGDVPAVVVEELVPVIGDAGVAHPGVGGVGEPVAEVVGGNVNAGQNIVQAVVDAGHDAGQINAGLDQQVQPQPVAMQGQQAIDQVMPMLQFQGNNVQQGVPVMRAPGPAPRAAAPVFPNPIAPNFAPAHVQPAGPVQPAPVPVRGVLVPNVPVYRAPVVAPVVPGYGYPQQNQVQPQGVGQAFYFGGMGGSQVGSPGPQQFGSPQANAFQVKSEPVNQFDPSVQQRFLGRYREFKVSGQIGKPGEKGKLTYSNLSFQILNAQAQNFSTREITMGVCKAIAGGIPLRTVLESKPDADLAFLYVNLRAHFKERDATAAFNEMNNEVQHTDEGAIEFCMRMIGERERVLMLTLEEGNEYSRSLVQKQFQHVLLVGLRNEMVRQEMRVLLKTPSLDDGTLLTAMGEAVRNETERGSKIAVQAQSISTPATVNVLSSPASDEHLALMKQMKVLMEKVGNLMGLEHQMLDMRKDMKVMQRQMWGIDNPANYQHGQNYNVDPYAVHNYGGYYQNDVDYGYNNYSSGGNVSNTVPVRGAHSARRGHGGRGAGRGGRGGAVGATGGNVSGGGVDGAAGGGGVDTNGRGATYAARASRGAARRPGGGRRGVGQRGRCETCVTENARHCPHCLQCGCEGHRMSDCPLNEEGSH